MPGRKWKTAGSDIETLKDLGVEEASIQTSAYGLNPIYDWDSGDRAVTGYEMTTEITVSDIPIEPDRKDFKPVCGFPV